MVDKTLGEIKKGEQAEKILDSEVFKDAYNAVEQEIIEAISASALGDERTHNRLAIALQIHRQLKKKLTDVMQTGKMAKLQVNDKKFKVFG
jgi:hypothetical protein